MSTQTDARADAQPDPPRASDSQVRPRRPEKFGRFELTGRLRTGGMAEIFEARVVGGSDERFALKRILPSFTDEAEYVVMFLDESRLALKLSHPNIVRAHEMGQVDDIQFLLLEYVFGVDLGSVLKRARDRSEPLEPMLACRIARELCAALHYAHGLCGEDGVPLDLVHRDVSPQNVLLSATGEVKLIDFGIAKSTEQAKRTQAGFFKGKFGYLSPEQATGEELDHRSDLFSLGVCLWEMLTAERLFEGGSDFSTLQRVRKAEVPELHDKNPRVPEELSRIVHKLLAKRADDRYETAVQVAEELERFAGTALADAAALAAFVQEGFGSQLAERFAADASGAPAEEGTGLSAFDALEPVSAISTMSSLGEAAGQDGDDDAASAEVEAAAAIDAPAPSDADPEPPAATLDADVDATDADDQGDDAVTTIDEGEHTQDATDQIEELRAAVPRQSVPAPVPLHLQGARATTLPGLGMEWDDEELATQDYETGAIELESVRQVARELMQGPPTSAPPVVSASTPSSRAPVRPSAPPRSTPPAQVAPAPRASQAPAELVAPVSMPPQPRSENTWLLVAALLLVAVAAGMVVMHLQRSEKATVHLTTMPLDAVVRVNGVRVGGSSSPYVLTDLPAETLMELRVEKPGYRSWTSQVTLHPGQLLELPQVALPSEDGSLPITSSVSVVAPPVVVQQVPAVPAPVVAIPVAAAPAAPVPAPSATQAPHAKVPAPESKPAVAAAAPTPTKLESSSPATRPSGATRPATRAEVPVVAAVPARKQPASSGAASTESATGVLRINSRPWSELRIDGRPAGNTPQMSLKLSAGKHTVKLTNAEFGLSKTVEIEIVAGQTTTRVVNLAE